MKRILFVITVLLLIAMVTYSQTKNSVNDTITYTMKVDSGDYNFMVSYPIIIGNRPEAKKIKISIDTIINSIKRNRIQYLDIVSKEELQLVHHHVDINVIYNNHNIFSIVKHMEGYTGSSNPYNFTDYYHYDTKSVNTITLNDLFRQGYNNELLSIAKDIFYKQHKKPDCPDFKEKFELNGKFYFTDKKITFLLYYEACNIGDYSFEVEIPFSEIKDLINPNGSLGWVAN